MFLFLLTSDLNGTNKLTGLEKISTSKKVKTQSTWTNGSSKVLTSVKTFLESLLWQCVLNSPNKLHFGEADFFQN